MNTPHLVRPVPHGVGRSFFQATRVVEIRGSAKLPRCETV